jgi:hypothetical protein
MFLGGVLVAFIIGYIVGAIFIGPLKKILRIDKFEKVLVKYCTMTTKMWEEIVNFLGVYVKWLIVVAVLNYFMTEVVGGVPEFEYGGIQANPLAMLQAFMMNLLVFIVLGIVGLVIGGFFYRLIKDVFDGIGLGGWMKKYNVEDAVGGVPVSNILAGAVKWYVVLLFIQQGAMFLQLSVLTEFIDGLVTYIPQAVLGGLIMLVVLILADFTGDSIRKSKVGFAHVLAMIVEGIIIFFGIVIALPEFGVENTSILEESFKILVVGLSIGLAIALGLGLKDSVARIGQKYEKGV